MLASVNTRNPIPLGHLAVNNNAKAAPAQRVADALLAVARVLLPRVAPFELTVESLNAAPAVPRKDYAADCLVGGPLQLAEETLLLVDETRLVSGKLGPVGVSNLEALKAVAEEQALEYDFEFHKLPVHTNLKMLIVSDKSPYRQPPLFPCGRRTSLALGVRPTSSKLQMPRGRDRRGC